MKKVLFLFAMLLLSCASTFGQTIPNAGFENWSWVPGQYMYPSNWITNAGDVSIQVFRETPGQTGSYALQLNKFGYARAKFPLQQYPFSFQAYVKTIVATNATVKISVLVYSGNQLLATQEWENSTSIPNWAPISISVADVLPIQPDSIEIRMTSGGQNGSRLSVDNLSLSQITGLEEPAGVNVYEVYPNPFSSEINFKASKTLSGATITLRNYLGQTVQELSAVSGNFFTIQRNKLPAGVYFIYLSENNRIDFCRKIVIVD